MEMNFRRAGLGQFLGNEMWIFLSWVPFRVVVGFSFSYFLLEIVLSFSGFLLCFFWSIGGKWDAGVAEPIYTDDFLSAAEKMMNEGNWVASVGDDAVAFRPRFENGDGENATKAHWRPSRPDRKINIRTKKNPNRCNFLSNWFRSSSSFCVLFCNLDALVCGWTYAWSRHCQLTDCVLGVLRRLVSARPLVLLGGWYRCCPLATRSATACHNPPPALLLCSGRSLNCALKCLA